MADESEPLSPAFDPDCTYRAIALLCAAISNPGKPQVVIIAHADVFLEYIDPFSFDHDPDCEIDDSGIHVTLHRKP